MKKILIIVLGVAALVVVLILSPFILFWGQS